MIGRWLQSRRLFPTHCGCPRSLAFEDRDAVRQQTRRWSILAVHEKPAAGGPVMRIAESRKSCAPFIAFFAMSGRCNKIVAGRGWSHAERPETVSKRRVALVSMTVLDPTEGTPGPSPLGTGDVVRQRTRQVARSKAVKVRVDSGESVPRSSRHYRDERAV